MTKRADCMAARFESQDIDPALRFHRQLDVDRALLFAERAAQLRKRDVLQLANPFAGDAEFLAHFLERLRFAAV